MCPDIRQEGEIHPVGETRPIKVDVRVVVATNRDLATEIAAGRFRADLFYRLNVFNIHLPPIRSERERIKLLIAYYFDHYCQQARRHELQLSAEAIELLLRYDWPGNVRELCNEVLRLVLYSVDGEVISAEHLSPDILNQPILDKTLNAKLRVTIHEEVTLKEAMAELERQLITITLTRHNGNLTRAARSLNLTIKGLKDKMRRLGVERTAPSFSAE